MNINYLPNIITISGLVIVNLSLFFYYKFNKNIYLFLMLLGFSCDYFDGYIARKYNVSSSLGNILDKLTDKINQFCLLLILVLKYKVSYWYILCLFIRETIMFYMRKNNIKPKTSSIHGKLKTFIFPISIILYNNNFSFKEDYLFLLTLYNFITLIL